MIGGGGGWEKKSRENLEGFARENIKRRGRRRKKFMQKEGSIAT